MAEYTLDYTGAQINGWGQRISTAETNITNNATNISNNTTQLGNHYNTLVAHENRLNSLEQITTTSVQLTGGAMVLWRRGNIVSFEINGVLNAAWTQWGQLGSLPEGWQPPWNVFCRNSYPSSAGDLVSIYITEEGAICSANNVASGTTVWFYMTYIVA